MREGEVMPNGVSRRLGTTGSIALAAVLGLASHADARTYAHALAQEIDCPSAPEASGVAVVTVEDAATGVRLPRATVRLTSLEPDGSADVVAEGRTDRNGQIRFCDLPRESMTARATFAGVPSEPVSLTWVGRHVEVAVPVPVQGVEEAGPALEARVVSMTERSAGRLLGTAVDRESGRPIDGLFVRLSESDRGTTTDAGGRFMIDPVPAGNHMLEARHIAYGTVEHRLTIPPNRSVEVQLELIPAAIPVEPIVVVTVRQPELERSGFYERRRWGEATGLGFFFDREDIERRNPLRLSHLIQPLPSVNLERFCPRGHCMFLAVFGSQTRLMYAGASRTLLPCPADLWIDGVNARLFRLDNVGLEVRDGLDDLIHPADIAGIEVYRRASEVPAEFAGLQQGCGAVVVWTRRTP